MLKIQFTRFQLTYIHAKLVQNFTCMHIIIHRDVIRVSLHIVR